MSTWYDHDILVMGDERDKYSELVVPIEDMEFDNAELLDD